jgi:hypothetical protein
MIAAKNKEKKKKIKKESGKRSGKFFISFRAFKNDDLEVKVARWKEVKLKCVQKLCAGKQSI